MEPERWGDVDRLYHEALDHPEKERAAFLKRACAGDEALHQAVESLLAAHAKADEFLEVPAIELAARALAEAGPAEDTDLLDTDLLERLRAGLADRYLIERELGHGGMARVYLAQDRKHQRQVAIKVLRPDVGVAIGGGRFLREIGIAARLTHPHIVPVFDSGEAEGCLFYVMPYIAGEALRERLRREGRLPLSDALALICEVADALAFAHRAGLVHRDIKPENILLQAGHAVLSDFGIARAVSAATPSRMTATGLAVGTPEYMSPEQAAGRADVDGRSDIYSLGCVAFEMLVGRPLFSGTTPQRVLAQKLGTAAPVLSLLESVPEHVSRAITRSLQPDRDDRFATAGEFAAALTGDAGPAESRDRRDLLPALLGVTGFVAALSFGWWLTHRSVEVSAGVALDPTHIAVLYFDVLNDSARLTPVAAGLTEDLIDALSEVRSLSVKSSGAVRPYRGRRISPDSIARDRNVGTIVTGSVAARADTLRVTVRLADGATGQQVYSRTVKRLLGDLFQLEDSLALDLARFLRERLGATIQLRERQLGTKRVDAWRTLRRADELRDEADSLQQHADPGAAVAMLVRADTVYAEAARLDPRWTVPLVERARVALTLSQLVEPRPLEPVNPSVRPLAADEWLRVGLGYVGRAFAITPDDPRALQERGMLRYELWIDSYVAAPESVAQAEQDFRQAVAREPSLARAWYGLSELLRFTGRFREADWAAGRALDADAYLTDAQRVYNTLFYSALNLQNFAKAAEWCRIGRERYPAPFRDCEVRILGWSARGATQVSRAWREVSGVETGRPEEQAGPFWADRRLLVAAILARSGMADSARVLIRLARAGDAADTAATWMLGEEAWVRVLLNERDSALRLLSRYVATARQMRAYIRVSPWYAALHADPEFQALVGAERAGS